MAEHCATGANAGGPSAASVYLDTSALVPYYRPEAASSAVEEYLRSAGQPLTLSRLTDVELASALNRLLQMGELEEPHLLLIEAAYLDDLREGRFDLVALPPTAFARARLWLSERKLHLRTLDALHLAACRELGAGLVTCDQALHAAALDLGMDSRLLR